MRTATSFSLSFTAHRASRLQNQIRLTRTSSPLMSAPNGQQPLPASAQAGAADKKTASIPKGKKELKILMLHGYTQSGALFSSKTKALSKLLTKALGPAPLSLHPTLLYPTGPHRLRASDIPGYAPPGDDDDGDSSSDNWAWFRKDEATGAYRGFEAGMHALARAIRDAGGGVDGVVGFSQGAAVAALVAAAMERPHRALPPPDAPSPSSSSSSSSPPSAAAAADWSWVTALREANGGEGLRFCVAYSGFYAPVEGLRWLYEPPVATPTLHFLGSLDTVVEEARSRALVDRCRDPAVLVHPGGHYVPVAKDWVMPLVGWLRQRLEESDAESKESL